MGSLTKQVLGILTGKVGGCVIRKRYGKYVAYKLPEKVNISQTPQAKNARAKFRPMSRFASYVNSIPELNYIWKKEKVNASSPYHKILKVNYASFEHNRPTISNAISVEGPLFCPVTGSSVNSKGFRVEMMIKEGSSFLKNNIKEIMGIGIVCFYEPPNKRKEYFTLSKIILESVSLVMGKPFEIFLPFDEEEKEYYALYKTCILYFTLVTKDKNGIPLGYCMSYSNEFMRAAKTVRKVKQ
jgi:hypothetical protein